MRRVVALLVLPLVVASAASTSSAQRTGTSRDIGASDLRQRLFAFAHDSMMGREPGQEGNFKASAYVAAEFQRLGLEPAGDNGTYFQEVPFFRRAGDRSVSLRLGNRVLVMGRDYVPSPVAARPRSMDGVPTVYGGLATDPGSWIEAHEAKGKVVVIGTLPAAERTVATRSTPMGALLRAPNFAGAAALMVVDYEASGSEGAARAMSGNLVQDTTWNDHMPPLIVVSRSIGDALFESPLASAPSGAPGKAFSGEARVGLTRLAYPARNVVAILRGTNPAIRGQYVSVTAHNDHVGFDRSPVDHDSLRAFNRVVRPMGADSPRRDPTEPEWARIRATLDSLRKMNPPRADSIRNGADDDGSGTVALLDIAERMSQGPRPQRSILFVSHTAEEFGLLGSRWYTDHPTVPIDSIVGEIDVDMIGRGGADDLPDAGPTYLEVIGLRRLSNEFGDVIDAANAKQARPFVFNLTFDAPGHPLQYYCRADHYSYARYGIPSVSISRGEHLDYHQVTDEAQYIDYESLARVATFVHDAALMLGNRPTRPALDGPKGDRGTPCRQ
ncbi:MAG: M28 family peptidase [Gemmatimonadaceae bacterium]